MLTFTKSMLALSVMAAVGGANAATYTEDTTLTDKIFTEGIMAIDGATVTVTGDEIAGKWFKATNHSQDVGSKTPSSMQQPAPISILRTRNIVPSASLRFRKLKLKSMAIYMSMPVPPLLPEVRLSLTSTKTKTPIPSSNSTATSISTTINQPVKPLFVLL